MIEPGIARLAEELDGIDTIWTIGSGPSRGTAQYCAAKFHEQMPINGIAGDLGQLPHRQVVAPGARDDGPPEPPAPAEDSAEPARAPCGVDTR